MKTHFFNNKNKTSNLGQSCCIIFTVITMDFLKKYGILEIDEKLLETALTHTSYSNEHNCESYERLEFLGDAVLELIISELLYQKFNLPEGEMTKMRANYVCEHALYEYSKEIGFIPLIRLGNGLHNVNETIVADVFEAILGTIYLSNGIDIAKKYIHVIVMPHIEKNTSFNMDYKSLLQEMVQTDKGLLEYNLVEESGPAHEKNYVVDVIIDNIVYGRGTGRNKKEAEQNAAKDAYQKCVK